MLTKAEAEDIFDFDYTTGVARWRRGGSGITAGAVAGNSTRRYVWIKLCGKYISGHKLAWLMYYGEPAPKNIDHINGNTFDNRKENLRLADQRQNAKNKGPNKSRKNGHIGVRRRENGKWQARVCADYKLHTLGTFDTEAEAIAAYKDGTKRLFGEFARAL